MTRTSISTLHCHALVSYKSTADDILNTTSEFQNGPGQSTYIASLVNVFVLNINYLIFQAFIIAIKVSATKQ